MSLLDSIREQLGGIDLYLLDQVLKGRVDPSTRVLDAGCGDGRNLELFLRAGLAVFALDRDPAAIERVQARARRLAPQLGADHFRCEAIETTSFPAGGFDLVIANAVLHFAAGEAHFQDMLAALWRLVSPGGTLFVRLASRIGIESQVVAIGEGRYRLPDGSDRFLVDRAMLAAAEERLGAEPIEPLRTVNVEGQRAMTTWVLHKRDTRR